MVSKHCLGIFGTGSTYDNRAIAVVQKNVAKKFKQENQVFVLDLQFTGGGKNCRLAVKLLDRCRHLAIGQIIHCTSQSSFKFSRKEENLRLDKKRRKK